MKGWRTKTLGEVCEYDRTFASDSNLPYLGMEQIGSGTGQIIGELLPAATESSSFAFDTAHVLYGRLRPYLSKVALPSVRGRCSTELFPLRPTPEIAREFLYYWLLSPRTAAAIDRTSTGARMPRANMNEVAQLPIDFPPLPEQHRIVAILDDAFAAIAKATANAERNLANADELTSRVIEQRLQSLNAPKTVSVQDLASNRRGAMRTGPFGSQLLHSEFVEDGPIAVLGIDNVVKNQFTWKRRRYISMEKYANLQRYTVKPGDVLISIMATCGRCAVVPDDIEPAINSKHLCCITLDKKICLSEFLHTYFLFHPRARAHLAQHTKGSIMDGLNMGIIQRMPVELPSMSDQNDLVAFVASVRAQCVELEDVYLNKLADLAALQQTILHYAFSGQLSTSPPIAA